MPSLSTELLVLAQSLLAQRAVSDAGRRRAASTAYYALFHRLCALCANQLMGPPASDPLHRRAYRALEHRQVREALARGDDFAAALGADFAKLQDVRHWADYSSATHYNEREVELGKAFTVSEARDCLELAKRAIASIDGLEMRARRRLATQLLVRDRR